MTVRTMRTHKRPPVARKLHLGKETLRTLTDADLRAVRGADGIVDVSIVYWCETNTSIQRSCSSCTSTTSP